MYTVIIDVSLPITVLLLVEEQRNAKAMLRKCSVFKSIIIVV